MSLITCKDVTLGYDNTIVAKDVSFCVNKGDYLCIVGQNGSGKSTLMKTLLGLQKPLAGKITFGDGLQQNQIGYLPQQNVVQKDFPASVWEVVLSGCQNNNAFRPFYTTQQKATAMRNIEKMGLSGMEGCCYRELSGGQQQRVLLARALCATRTLLLLDEPVSGLDPQVTTEMYNLIEKLNKIDGITIVMISHDISTAIKYATHVLHVANNVCFATKKDYLQKDIAKQFVGGNL